MQLATLRSAQLRYDHLLPVDEPTIEDWLETTAGANWVYDAARDLVRDCDLKISGRTVLCCSVLHDAVHALIEERLASDHDKNLAQAFVWQAAGANADHFLESLISTAEIEKLAEGLVRPFAALGRQEIIDDEMDD